MGISSQDDLAAALALGQTNIAIYSKNALGVAAQAAGVWYDLSKGEGSIAWDALIGSGENLTFQPPSDTTVTTAAIAFALSRNEPPQRQQSNPPKYGWQIQPPTPTT